jgi:azurin
MRNILFVISTSIFLISCGGAGAEGSAKNDRYTDENKGKTAITLELNSNDRMEYDKTVLHAYEGQEITLILNHTGKESVQIMGHNFVLLKDDVDVDRFAAAASKARENDYIPARDEIIVHTKMLGGGERDTLVFTAPAKGFYDYICTYPGHYMMMRGQLAIH